MDLVENSIFPTPPDEELAKAFRAHVILTGRPETFPGISTAKPPKDTALKALVHPVDLNRALRPGGEEAPCPICSPRDPKWLGRGTLLWCEATQAIYCIGPNCSKTLWDDGRLDREINLLRRSDRERANAGGLVAAIASVERLVRWIDQNKVVVERSASLHRDFTQAAPKFRGALSRWLKTDNRASAIQGQAFTRGTWPADGKLGETKVTLRALAQAAGADPAAWVAGLSPTTVELHLVGYNTARKALETAGDRVSTASDFLSADNVKALGTLSRTDHTPAPFTVTRTATGVEFRSREEVWRASTGLGRPTLLPGA